MPIYKNGNKEESLNYRPVPLTSIVCNIYEVIKKQRTGYFRKRRNNNRGTIWIQNRKVMCHQFDILLKNNSIYITQERDVWANCIYLYLKSHSIMFRTGDY